MKNQTSRLSAICAVASIGLIAQPSLATDNAFIQEWAKERAGNQPRLMPEIHKPAASGGNATTSSTSQLPAQQQVAPKPPVTGGIVPKGVTVCNSNLGVLSDNLVFRCGAFGNESVTVQSLYAKGWRIVLVWPVRNELQMLAEER